GGPRRPRGPARVHRLAACREHPHASLPDQRRHRGRRRARSRRILRARLRRRARGAPPDHGPLRGRARQAWRPLGHPPAPRRHRAAANLGGRPEIHLGSRDTHDTPRRLWRWETEGIDLSRVPRMPRWPRQPRHAGRAWYYPFTLASGSDPRHGSRVALLARVKPALGLRGIVENERRYAWLIALAVLTGVLGAVGNVVFRDAILGATWLFQGRVAPLGRIGIPLALIGGGLVLLALDRLFPGEVLGYGFPRFLEMLHLHGASVKRRWMVVKTLGAAISLGAGAAVGREGPIAQIGGSIGAAVARLARLATEERKVLIACGAGAGIATTFNA